jgi:hypothetical protein
MSTKKILPSKTTCTNVAGCSCLTCGQVRLLFEQERQRYLTEMDPSPEQDESAVPCTICASEEMRLTLMHCPLCGAPGLLSEINALAQTFIDDYLNKQGQGGT